MGTGDGSEGRDGKGRTVGERRVSCPLFIVHSPSTLSTHRRHTAHCSPTTHPPLLSLFHFRRGEGRGQGCRENEERVDPVRVFVFTRVLLYILILDPTWPPGVPDGRGGPWIVIPEIDKSVSAEALVEMS